MFPWEGKYHLFHLEKRETGWSHVGRAVSTDLVHWETLPSICTRGEPGAWNEGATTTGKVLQHQGTFYLFVGSYRNDREEFGVHTSPDLEHWTPHPANPISRAVGADYLTDPAKAPYRPIDWRDPCVIWREADHQFHAVLCTRTPHWGHADTGAVVAHIRSPDLIHWEPLPPLLALGQRFYHCEVPDIFELNGRWYVTFGSISSGGIKINTPDREEVTGVFYATAEQFAGPYTLHDDPLLVGAGYGKMMAYSGGSVPYEGGRVLYHHIAGERPSCGAPKRMRTGADGTLWLEYLPAMEKLVTGVLRVGFDDLPPAEIAYLGPWERQDGKLVGTAQVIGTSCRVAEAVSDLHLTCRIAAASAASAGVVLRGSIGGGVGAAVMLDYEQQRLRLATAIGYAPTKGPLGAFESWHCTTLDACRFRLKRDRRYLLRCLVRECHLEVYLDERWVFTTAIPGMSPAGSVELSVERGEAAFSDLRIATLEALCN
jgi:hypothetical protein